MCNLSEGVEKKGIEKGIQLGIQQGKIYGAIEVYQDQGMSGDEILKEIQKRFSLTEDEAKAYMAYSE